MDRYIIPDTYIVFYIWSVLGDQILKTFWQLFRNNRDLLVVLWCSCLGPINIVNRVKADVWSPAQSRKFCQILCKSQIATDFFLPELENQGLLSCKPSFSIMAFEVLPFHSRRRLHGRPFSMFAILPEYVQIFQNI